MLDRTLANRLNTVGKNVLLLGARQVGKTTLIKSLSPAKFINLADESIFISYSKEPAKLIREIKGIEGSGVIVIDEIQRVPRLLNSVQVLIDEAVPFNFILTGSSARKLKRGHANLLPGRIVLEYLDPLSVEEIGGTFDIDRALQIGCLPGIYLDKKYGTEILSTYATTYLKEEIQAEALTRELGSYSRFLDVAAACSGQWINYSKLSNDSEIPKETIRRFFSILEDTLIAFRIPPFRLANSKRRVSHRDRFLFFDNGVRNAVAGVHSGSISPSERGLLFEHLVILQIIYYMRSHKKQWKLFSYRTDAGAEVDLIIDTSDFLAAIECKYGTNVHENDLKGLRSFEKISHKPLKKIVVYRGNTRQVFSKGETAIPFHNFFLEDVYEL